VTGDFDSERLCDIFDDLDSEEIQLAFEVQDVLQELSLPAREVRSTRRVVPGRRRARAYGRSGEGAEGPAADAGHMQAHPRRRQAIVVGVMAKARSAEAVAP